MGGGGRDKSKKIHQSTLSHSMNQVPSPTTKVSRARNRFEVHGFSETLAPWWLAHVMVIHSVHGSGSRDSIVRKCCMSRTVVYEASVRANCSVFYLHVSELDVICG
ncbi:hypothetical protein I7I53_11228 [Histoplasma capsulatum var. duboisii H88]|uniref:Uncharacterized protein n=1 Tax=Ajellomyces capsulatus (strain H88) TaxID=544711 RepID=A0A8A1LA50_AJEC8|nr:hypothetical protein I7I53_11228 [Histoplasma capsulatum var. duboisii H88]